MKFYKKTNLFVLSNCPESKTVIGLKAELRNCTFGKGTIFVQISFKSIFKCPGNLEPL